MGEDRKDFFEYIRERYFLDPRGSNRAEFMKIMITVLDSITDWYLGGEPDENGHYSKSLGRIAESTLVDMVVKGSERVLDEAPKAVPSSLSREKLEQKFRLDCETGYRFPENPMSIDDVMVELDKATSPSIRFNSNFIGQMHPHDNIIAYAASLIAKFLNTNQIAYEVSPTLTYMEEETVKWLASLIGYDPKKAGGNIVSGGTIANLTALLVARNRKLKIQAYDTNLEAIADDNKNKKYIGVAEEGLLECLRSQGKMGAVVFSSEEAHYSIEKLCGYIGIGTNNHVKVRSKNGRMDVEDLKRKIRLAKDRKSEIVAIVATAGTTEKGNIDPLNEIANIAEQEGIYLHVDAAHGGGFLTSKRFRPKFSGIERADSVTIDGHKMFYTNYPCGGVVFRDGNAPIAFLKQTAEYILRKKGEHKNEGSQTLEGSRGSDGVMQLWASLKGIGRIGYEALVEHTVEITQYLKLKIDESQDFEALSDPELNVLCFRYVPSGLDRTLDNKVINQVNSELWKKMYDDGMYYLGNTSFDVGVHKVESLKTVVMHPYTEKDTIDGLLARLRELGQEAYQGIQTQQKL